MIAGVRLVNIQSFKDITLKLGDGVNVFEAPNETGKSVIFKLFRIMCDANWYGRGMAKDIIRRGFDSGAAILSVYDVNNDAKYIVQFFIFQTYQVYKLFNSDGEEMGQWKQQTIPEEIEDILGWKYDKESRILLNLCDQELGMPFVDSNLKYNYESVRFVIYDKKLDTARATLSEWIKELDTSTNQVALRRARHEGALYNMKHVDVASLEHDIEKRKKKAVKAKALANLLEGLCAIDSLEEPEFESVDLTVVENSIEASSKLRDFGLLLQDIYKMQKPVIREVNLTSVENSIEACKVLSLLGWRLREVSNTIDSIKQEELMIQNSKEVIRDFEEKHEVCPLCGQHFGEENHNECS